MRGIVYTTLVVCVAAFWYVGPGDAESGAPVGAGAEAGAEAEAEEAEAEIVEEAKEDSGLAESTIFRGGSVRDGDQGL